MVFSSRIASVFTGLVFLLLMTRSLTVPQYGLWEVILDMVTFASYPAGLLVFWATRDIARGKLLGRTAIGMNLLLSLLGIVLYAIFSVVTAHSIATANLGTLLLAVLLIPIGYWNQAANAVVSGHNPIVAGYSVISSEVSKLAVALPALLLLHLGIGGVILSVMTANVAQAATSTYLTRDADILPLDLESGRRWLSHTLFPGLTTLPFVLGVADTYIASVVAHQTTLVAYYQAAFAVATIAGYSYYLASALYPLLLRGGSDELTTASLDLTLLFGVPMAVGAAALAKPILFLLKPAYAAGDVALVILSFSALVNSVSLILDQTLMGRDRVDVDSKASFQDYLKSTIFFVAKVDISTTVAYLASVFLVVALGTADGVPAITIVEYWAAGQLAIFSLFAAIKVRRAARSGRLVYGRSLLNYIIGSAIMGAFLVASAGLVSYTAGSVRLAADLAGLSLAAIAIYGGYVLATEQSVRRLVRMALRPVARR